MTLFARLTVFAVLASATAGQASAQSGAPAGQTRVRIYADQAHGQAPVIEPYAALTKKLGAEMVPSTGPITPKALEGIRLLFLRAPVQEFTSDERAAVSAFVNAGGRLFLAFDEERRTPLELTRVNELIAPFGFKLTADTEYIHNNGAIAKQGRIHAADREVPFSGGRAVEGGTPFAWQLDRDGKPAQAFGASAIVGKGGRVIVLADAMATLFLGSPDGVRLTGVPRDPSRTTYWGKDSAIFMEELLTWLIQ